MVMPEGLMPTGIMSGGLTPWDFMPGGSRGFISRGFTPGGFTPRGYPGYSQRFQGGLNARGGSGSSFPGIHSGGFHRPLLTVPQRSRTAPDHPPQHAPRPYLHIPASPSPLTNPTRRPSSPSQSTLPLPTSSPQQQAPRVGVVGGPAHHE